MGDLDFPSSRDVVVVLGEAEWDDHMGSRKSEGPWLSAALHSSRVPEAAGED